jgi:hypothetical protein
LAVHQRALEPRVQAHAHEENTEVSDQRHVDGRACGASRLKQNGTDEFAPFRMQIDCVGGNPGNEKRGGAERQVSPGRCLAQQNCENQRDTHCVRDHRSRKHPVKDVHLGQIREPKQVVRDYQ